MRMSYTDGTIVEIHFLYDHTWIEEDEIRVYEYECSKVFQHDQ